MESFFFSATPKGTCEIEGPTATFGVPVLQNIRQFGWDNQHQRCCFLHLCPLFTGIIFISCVFMCCVSYFCIQSVFAHFILSAFSLNLYIQVHDFVYTAPDRDLPLFFLLWSLRFLSRFCKDVSFVIGLSFFPLWRIWVVATVLIVQNGSTTAPRHVYIHI